MKGMLVVTRSLGGDGGGATFISICVLKEKETERGWGSGERGGKGVAGAGCCTAVATSLFFSTRDFRDNVTKGFLRVQSVHKYVIVLRLHPKEGVETSHGRDMCVGTESLALFYSFAGGEKPHVVKSGAP